MKRILLVLVSAVCFFPSALAREDSVGKDWDKANTLYINGDYSGAAAFYETIAAEGYVSGKLFYNLGNAYFKAGDLGRSILNYNKALKLAPLDKDTEYNLAVANGYARDKIDSVPEFFLTKWLGEWRSSLDSNAWAVISLLMLALALSGILVFFMAERRALRKAGFFYGTACLVLFVCTTVFAAVGKKEMVQASGAIVLAQAASVKSSPDNSGGDLFIIHEGTKVKALSFYGQWTEIMIADGNKGWVPASSIELIKY